MGLDGGRIAARGYEYQYLRTVEALLAGFGTRAVAACRIEGPAGLASLQHADAVDFDLVDDDDCSLLAVQVKNVGTGRDFRARDALEALVHLVQTFEAQEYRLITTAAPTGSVLELTTALHDHGKKASILKAEVEKLLVKPSAIQTLCRNLALEQWERLGRATIEFDRRDDEQLREELAEKLRRCREQAGRGISRRSGGLLLNYLVAEVLRRAANPQLARWSTADFERSVLLDDGELIDALGRQDFGLVFGRIPRVPEVERPEAVDTLSEYLRGPNPVGPGVRVCSITGLSGVGKSSLAAAHVAHCGYRYDAIFWVDAESEESLIASFARVLAHLTGQPHPPEVTDPHLLRELVHARLQSLPGPWLMVFDDAIPRSADSWLPRLGRGRIIITSLGGHWRSAHHRIELEPMNQAEAAQLLRLRLRLGDQETKAHAASLSALAHALEYWPLAVEVACAYLLSCAIPVDRLASYTETLISSAAHDVHSTPDGYPRTLAAAVGLSVERLINSARVSGLVSPTLVTLAALCWLGPRRAPVHLAVACAFVSAEDLAGNNGWVVLDETQVPVREIIRELLNVSFVRYDTPLSVLAGQFASSDDTVSMNAVLQLILAHHLHLSDAAPTALPHLAAHTERWLRGAINHGEAERAWELAQHATALIRNVEKTEVVDTPIALLMGNLAVFHQAHGQYDAATRLLESELAWLERSGNANPGLVGPAHCSLAHLAQLRQHSDTAQSIARHLQSALRILQSLTPASTALACDIATEACLILQTQLRLGQDATLAALLGSFRAVAEGLESTEISQLLKDLGNVEELLSSDHTGLRAEQAARAALAQSTRSWAMATADLHRLLTEALVRQRKWQQANTAFEDFLPFTGSRTLHAFAIHHLVHNVGFSCAFAWVLTGEQPAIELLGRILAETGIQENPALETPTDHARFLLLEAVHCGWQAVHGQRPQEQFLGLMRQLRDEIFTDPHDPHSPWERIWHGMLPRLSAVVREKRQRDFEAAAHEAFPAGAALDPAISPRYEQAACLAVAALSTDAHYGQLVGASDIDLLLPNAPRHRGVARPLVILQPTAMIGATIRQTGKSIELQVQRACDKGLRRLIGPVFVIPTVSDLTLTLTTHDFVLQHKDGTVLARASASVPAPWREAARTRGYALVFFGYGFDLNDPAEHQRVMATPSATARAVRDACRKGLLAAGQVTVHIPGTTATRPPKRPAAA